MKQAEKIDLSMRIAPKSSAGYWTAKDWRDAVDANKWPTMYRIFLDRLHYRYLSATDALVEADKCQPTRRFGFSIMALDCLLIETLAQFYQGLKTSDDARCEKGHKLSNTEFYVGFLNRDSLKLKEVFDTDRKARLFYKTIRCGILHQGETTEGSKIVTTGVDILQEVKQPDGLIINRSLFHKFLVEKEFTTYCDHLDANAPPEYRLNMIKKMGFICQIPFEDGDQG